ncbi:coq10 [Candida pseudojiufengensis]|uniref:coq10 n=1 Tax=Candida pseudojiufengensis TaxID=497109 RepID=UPI00222455C2|nr:coq10 [Candida pseudojiufengensis]KAI5964063.1 coq10 [Candida pseudojiufengensis]
MIRRTTQICFKRSFFGNSKPQTYSISKKLNGNSNQLYKIVSDVSNYKNFVPFVEDSFISKRDSRKQPSKAGLKIGWKDITEQFECKLDCIENEKVIARSIELDLFHELETEWNFKDTSSGDCQVNFTLLYKFKNPIYDQLSYLFAPQVTTIMINAFEQQLKQERISSKL